MRFVRAACAVVVLVGTGLGVTPKAAAAPTLTKEEASRQAKDAFSEGTSFFSLGKWNEAIECWQRGFQIKPDPIFLYNIAQAYRLGENHEQALFFYKSYLRNAPKASNREEVQDKMRELEKVIAARKSTREMAPDTPIDPSPQRPATTANPSQPVAAQTTSAPVPNATAVVEAAPTPQQKIRRGEVGVAGGVNMWLVGVPGGAQPSAGVSLQGGYALVAKSAVEFRLGGKVGYSYLVDLPSTDHFLSVLLTPKVSLRLWKEKLYATIEVGVGALVVAGVKSGSVLLDPRAASPGTLATFELRPAVGLEYRVLPAFSLYLAPAVIYSPAPSKAFGDAAVVRLDVSLGASLRL